VQALKRDVLKKIPLRSDPMSGWGKKIHWGLLALFALLFLLVMCAEITGTPAFAKNGKTLSGLLMLATATTLAALTLRLPGQNVILASAIISAIASAAYTLNGLTSIPFGPCIYTPTIDFEMFHRLPWMIPFVWVVVLLNARGVGKLMLRPWRKVRTYGFWLMGVTVALAVLFDLGMEPFASAKQLWLWEPTRAGLFWYGAPWINFVAWAMVAGITMAFVTPTLINKKPEKRGRDYHPLYIWFGLNLLLLVTAAMNHQWPAAAVIGIGNGIALGFALRGAFW
jgi:uncharacterized membrane protein